MLLEGLGCWPRETYGRLLGIACLKVGGSEPEDSIGARESFVDDVGVAMGALHNFDSLAQVRGNFGRIARDDADGFAAAGEDIFEDLAADGAGGSGDDDHDVMFSSIAGLYSKLYRTVYL